MEPMPVPETPFDGPFLVDPMLRFFTVTDLPIEVQPVAESYRQFATDRCYGTSPGPQRTLALQSLLSSRDAAIRSILFPGE